MSHAYRSLHMPCNSIFALIHSWFCPRQRRTSLIKVCKLVKSDRPCDSPFDCTGAASRRGWHLISYAASSHSIPSSLKPVFVTINDSAEHLIGSSGLMVGLKVRPTQSHCRRRCLSYSLLHSSFARVRTFQRWHDSNHLTAFWVKSFTASSLN